MLIWDTTTDTVTSGQWLLNKKLNTNCNMLSPDGKYFAYSMSFPKGPYKTYIGKGKGLEILTVVSKPPYFTGIVTYRHDIHHLYGDVYNHMTGANWVYKNVLLFNSDAKVEKGKCPKELKVVRLNIPDKLRNEIYRKKYGTVIDTKKHPKKHILTKDGFKDKKGRLIKLENSHLMVDGKSIHDFALDIFKYVKTPSNY